jgi:SAM-dependent methyltransferase
VDDFTEQRRTSFGAVAAQYDEARPGYPEKLVEDVFAYSGIASGGRALEIGAGTGQATAQFAWRGLSIRAIEPSVEMAALIREKFDGSGLDVTAEATDFETATLDPDSYDLVFAATSWHWLVPGDRWEAVARTLRPGGTLAVFWNWPHWRKSDLRDELDAVYERSGAKLDELGPMLKVEIDPGALAREWTRDAPDLDAFVEMKTAVYQWSIEYSAAEYVQLLGTYADHIGLDPEIRHRIFTEVAEVIDAHGGTLTLPHSTMLLLSKRARAAEPTATATT